MNYSGNFNDLLNFLLDAQTENASLMLVMSWRDKSIRGHVHNWAVPSDEQTIAEGEPDKGVPEISVDFGERSIVIGWDINTLEEREAGENTWCKMKPEDTLHRGAWVREDVRVTFVENHPNYPGKQAVFFDGPHACVLYKIG